MATRTFMLLGRSIWLFDGKGWSHESFSRTDDLINPAIARLADMLSRECKVRNVIVFEPEGLAHQTVESPNVRRSVYGTLARVRAEHPVVLSESLGWGIELPEPVPSGAFCTLMHSELTPGLVRLHDACIQAGSRLSAAWSAYTAAAAGMKIDMAAPKARFVIILVPGFAGVAVHARGRRSFRGWTGPMTDRDWEALSTLIGDFESRPAPSSVGAQLRRASITVIAEGESERSCPIWDEIRATGRLDEVVGIGTLAEGAARISTSHPGNLAEGFPRPRELDRYLVAATAGCLSAAVALGGTVPVQLKRLKSMDASNGATVAVLEAHLADLGRNRKEMGALRSEAAHGPGMLQVGRHEALIGLAAAVPDTLTITSLTISKDDGFVIEAIVVGSGFDPEHTRRELERRGFEPEGPNGWIFNATSGRLSVCGKIATPRP